MYQFKSTIKNQDINSCYAKELTGIEWASALQKLRIKKGTYFP
jgi:hypothetical protein